MIFEIVNRRKKKVFARLITTFEDNVEKSRENKN